MRGNNDRRREQLGEQRRSQSSSPSRATPTAAPDAGCCEQPQNPNMKWYIIHTYSGFERKVKESIESRVRAYPSWSTRSAGC